MIEFKYRFSISEIYPDEYSILFNSPKGQLTDFISCNLKISNILFKNEIQTNISDNK